MCLPLAAPVLTALAPSPGSGTRFQGRSSFPELCDWGAPGEVFITVDYSTCSLILANLIFSVEAYLVSLFEDTNLCVSLFFPVSIRSYSITDISAG